MRYLTAILLSIPVVAMADDERRYVTDQGAYAFTAADVAEVVTYVDRNGNSRPACFKYGLEVKTTADGGRVVTSFVIDDVVTFQGDPGQFNQATLVDAATFNGGGVGAILVPNERETVRVSYKFVYRSPGARNGLCTGLIEGPGRHVVRQGCDADGDCELGTCDTGVSDSERKDFGCAIMIAQASDSAAQLYWRIMKAKE